MTVGGEKKRDCQTARAGERETKKERERNIQTKKEGKRINQCGRFASLYTIHHAKLM